jgi:hypothetical protein
MTIIDFYKKLSKILTDCRENFTSRKEAQKRLDFILEEAKKNKLDVNINPEILDPINLMRLDDEKSFREESDDDYGFDSDFSYGNSSY